MLRTTAGTFPSNLIRMRTHTMSDTSGISVCFGNVQDKALLENAIAALEEMRAKWSDKIQIDTTHFVCTTPASTSTAGQTSGGAGVEYQRALQLSIPVVQPHWILACHAERKYVPPRFRLSLLLNIMKDDTHRIILPRCKPGNSNILRQSTPTINVPSQHTPLSLCLSTSSKCKHKPHNCNPKCSEPRLNATSLPLLTAPKRIRRASIAETRSARSYSRRRGRTTI